MAIWTREQSGSRENPGCFDRGNGSIVTRYVSDEVPGVVRCCVVGYAERRKSYIYYEVDGSRVSQGEAAKRCRYGVSLEWEDQYATGRDRVIPALSLTPTNLIPGWDAGGSGRWTEYAAACLALADRVARVERIRVAKVYTGSSQSGESYAADTYGYAVAEEDDPVRSVTTARVLVDADGDVICRWTPDTDQPAQWLRNKAREKSAEGTAAAERTAARNARLEELRPLYERAVATGTYPKHQVYHWWREAAGIEGYGEFDWNHGLKMLRSAAGE